MRKVFWLALLLLIGVFVLFNFGPVKLQRLIEFRGYSNLIYFPQWLNNEEYYYLRVENFFDYEFSLTAGFPEGYFNPLRILRPYNASFHLYKINVGKEVNEHRKIREITEKVGFKPYPDEIKLVRRENLGFRKLYNGNLLLFFKGVNEHIVYYITPDGIVESRKSFKEDIIDISPDNKKLLVREDLKIYAINMENKQKITSPALNRFSRFVTGDKLIKYVAEEKKESLAADVHVFLVDLKNNSEDRICSFTVSNRVTEKTLLLLDAAMFNKVNKIFLSRIGIFKKKEGNWLIERDLSEMEPLFYPDISPDGEKVVGVSPLNNEREVKLKIIKINEM